MNSAPTAAADPTVPGTERSIGSTAAPQLSRQQRAVLSSLTREVERQLPELTARAVRTITGRIGDSYGARGIVVADDLRSVTHANFAGMLRVLSGARGAGADDLSVALSTGRRRAEQGVPLEAVLHAFRLAGQELLSALLACARARPPHELTAFLGIATVAFDVVDTFSQAVVQGYRQTEGLLAERSSRRREAIMEALLEGTDAAPDELAEHASLLGLPPQGPYVFALCALDLGGRHGTTAPRDTCAAHNLASVWCTRGEVELGIVALGRTTPARLLEHLRQAVGGRLGVSSVFESLHEVPEAYRLAAIALRTLEPDAPGVAWIEERLLEAMVVSSPDLSGRLASHTLGRVLALRRSDRELLLETLSAWYESNRSASAAARQLYCHRNTVLNRLRRIEELIGASLEHHDGLIACYIALTALRLLPRETAREPAAGNAAGLQRSQASSARPMISSRSGPDGSGAASVNSAMFS